MKTSLVSISCLAAMVLAGCSKSGDEPTPPTPTPPDDPKPAQKTEIRISPSISESRATDYGFEAGDCIGLYVVNYSGTTAGTLTTTGNHVDNMRFTYSGTWTPDTPIYWADDQTHADFYLYYPYSTVTSVTAHPFDVLPDQSTEAAYKASDMLVGKALDVAPTATATVIPAGHVMSRIVINVEAGNGFTRESLAAATVAVKINGIRCGSTVNLATGAVTATGDPVSVTPLFADNAYKALIVPQTVADTNLITVTVNGTEFNLKKGFTFEGGKSHKFTVTVSKTSNGVNVNINPWEDDGTDNGGTAE